MIFWGGWIINPPSFRKEKLSGFCFATKLIIDLKSGDITAGNSQGLVSHHPPEGNIGCLLFC
jgi:hypothetical protein